MRRIVYLCSLILLTLSASLHAQTAGIIYAGTNSLRGSKGIYVLSFDKKQMTFTEIQTVGGGESPNFLALNIDKKHLYVACSKGTLSDGKGSVMSFTIDPKTGMLTKLNEQSSEGVGPAHVSVDPKGRFAYVSNYSAGNLAVYPINQDGSLGKASDVVQHFGKGIVASRQEAPHVHSTIPSADGKFIYVSDLGIDKIMIYEVKETGKLMPASTPFVSSMPGSGPRHLAIHPNGNFAYSAEELTSTVASYSVNKATGELVPLARAEMLPDDFTSRNSAADIHFSPDGKFLYASNRGHESLVIYKVNRKNGRLELVGHENTGGRHPRNFMIDKNGEFALVANRETDNIVVLKRNKKTGKLSPTGKQTIIPAVIALQQL
ncbi:lactonase family protein [Daejeonella sp.]|uniref:lactonase family protein n=1 Tax=Daejeonella sp. TaxID=2805397 RepID=UPI0030C13E60